MSSTLSQHSARCAARARFALAASTPRMAARRLATHTEFPPDAAPPTTPPPSSSETPVLLHKPSAFYSKPQSTHNRDLPEHSSPFRLPVLLAVGAAGVGAWFAFYAYATNAERISNSVTVRVLKTARASADLRAVLGEAVRPAPLWWLNGDPYISGAINTLQGHVDISLRVKGHKQSGTLYFTSARRAKGEPFIVLRFRVIADDGTVVEVSPSEPIES